MESKSENEKCKNVKNMYKSVKPSKSAGFFEDKKGGDLGVPKFYYFVPLKLASILSSYICFNNSMS